MFNAARKRRWLYLTYLVLFLILFGSVSLFAQDQEDDLYDSWGDVYPFNSYYTPPPAVESVPTPVPTPAPNNANTPAAPATPPLPAVPESVPPPAFPPEGDTWPYGGLDSSYGSGTFPEFSGTPAGETPTQKPKVQGEYSGYYQVGGQLYFYDQKTGKFSATHRLSVPASAGIKNGSAVAIKNGDFSATFLGGDQPPLMTFNEVSESTGCSLWRNPLKKTSHFDSSSECNSDLEDSVRKALERLEGEKSQFDRMFPLGASRLPVSMQEGFNVNRSKLQSSLEKISQSGCVCDVR